MNRLVSIRVPVILVLFATSVAAAQDGDELIQGFLPSEQHSMRRACYRDGLLGPASFRRCLKNQADQLHNTKRELRLGAEQVQEKPQAAPAAQTVESDPTGVYLIWVVVGGGWWLWRSYVSTRRRNPRIVFSANEQPPNLPASAAQTDVRDAVTGRSLHSSENQVECSRCHARYERESYQYLGVENNGRCAACGGTSFVPVREAMGAASR